jgi:hypothetical protein
MVLDQQFLVQDYFNLVHFSVIPAEDLESKTEKERLNGLVSGHFIDPLYSETNMLAHFNIKYCSKKFIVHCQELLVQNHLF